MIEATGLQETQLSIQESETNKLSNINFTDKKDKELMDAARQFEAVFVNQLFKSIDATVEKTGMFSGGKGEEVFRSMFFDEIAKDVSSNSATSFGIAKQIYEQMKHLV